jgi:PPM family protein phosphatase
MIRTNQAHLYVTAQTHPGMSGKNNEDNYAVSAYIISPMNPIPSVFAVVSDGIGGHKAGEVASNMVVELISSAVEKRNGGHPLEVFEESFYHTSEEVYQKAEHDSQFKGMGATAACAWVIGMQLYTATAGDSRIYFIRDRRIQQLSRDHTWVQEALEKGVIEKAVLKTHPNLHVIRRYIGSNIPPEPDLRMFLQPDESDKTARNNQGLALVPGDVVLLCTDGLSDYLDDAEILTLLQGRTLQQAGEAMIKLACDREGHDNITVVMLGVPWDAKSPNPGWVAG